MDQQLLQGLVDQFSLGNPTKVDKYFDMIPNDGWMTMGQLSHWSGLYWFLISRVGVGALRLFAAVFTVSVNHWKAEANSATEEGEKEKKLSNSNVDSATLQRKFDRLPSSGRWKHPVCTGPRLLGGAPSDLIVHLAWLLQVRDLQMPPNLDSS